MNLTDAEKTILQIFTSDSGAFPVVYKIAKSSIEKKRLLFARNITARRDLTNEQIGANLRAFDEAILMVEGVFRELQTYKDNPQPDTKNPGR